MSRPPPWTELPCRMGTHAAQRPWSLCPISFENEKPRRPQASPAVRLWILYHDISRRATLFFDIKGALAARKALRPRAAAAARCREGGELQKDAQKIKKRIDKSCGVEYNLHCSVRGCIAPKSAGVSKSACRGSSPFCPCQNTIRVICL